MRIRNLLIKADDYYDALDEGREPPLQPCQTTACEN